MADEDEMYEVKVECLLDEYEPCKNSSSPAMDFGLKSEVKTEPEAILATYDDNFVFVGCNMKPEEVDISDLEFPDESDSEAKTWPPALELKQDDIVSDSKSSCLGDKSFKMHTFSRNVEENEHAFTDSNPNQCQTCKKCFSSKMILARHIRSMHEKQHECKMCHNRFGQKQQLKSHMKSHSDLQARKCRVCDQWFVNEHGLAIHMSIHKGTEPFECSTCHKCFILRRQLKGHMRSHSNMRPFKCDVCDKAFKHIGHLLRHMPSHYSVPSYTTLKCPATCQERFLRKHSLKSHMRSHCRVITD